MKKQIINVFIAAAVLSALIGCGGRQVQNTSADHSAETSAAAGAAEKEKEGNSVQAGGTGTSKETGSSESNAAQDPKQSAGSVTSAQQQGAEQQNPGAGIVFKEIQQAGQYGPRRKSDPSLLHFFSILPGRL